MKNLSYLGHEKSVEILDVSLTLEMAIYGLSYYTYIHKGQLISKCPYEKSVSSKIPKKIFLDFCPEIFCTFLGASWKLFGLPGDLVIS